MISSGVYRGFLGVLALSVASVTFGQDTPAPATDAASQATGDPDPQASGEPAPEPQAAGSDAEARRVEPQPRDAAAEREAGDPEALRLPDIVVIGSASDVTALPGSGAVLGTEDIRTQSYDDPQQVLRKVPGVYFRQEDGYGNFPNISLRGVDTTRSAKVTIMEDSVLSQPAPYSAPSQYNTPSVGRMESIEVLKGSSQIRFGPHTTGGVINYRATSIPEEATAYLKALYGSHNELRVHGYIGDSIDTESSWGTVGFLGELYARKTDGFKRIDTTPDFQDGTRTGFEVVEPMLKLFWEPELDTYNRFEVKLGYLDRTIDEGYLGLSEDDIEATPFRRYSASRFDKFGGRGFRSYLRHTIQPAEKTQVTSTFYYNNFRRNWFKLNDVSDDPNDIPGSRESLARALAQNATHLAVLQGEAAGGYRYRNNSRSYGLWGIESVVRQDFEFVVPQEVTTGLRYHEDYVTRNQTDETFIQAANGTISDRVEGPQGGGGNRSQKTRALAFHVQDAVHATEKLTITPGIRVEALWQEFEDFNSGEQGTGDLNLIGGGVGANYAVDEEWTAFGGVYTGFSPPSPRAAIREGLTEEQSIGVEAGPRYQHESGVWGGTFVGFYTRFNDLIVIDNIGGTGTGSTENVGNAQVYGIELALDADPSIHFEWPFRNPWFLALTFTKSELVGDAQSTDPDNIFSGGLDGNEIPYIPPLTLSFGTGIEWGPVGFFLNGYYVTRTFTSANNVTVPVNGLGEPDSRFGTTDEYFLLDLSASYQFLDGVRVFGGIQNALDEAYITTRHPHGPRPGQPLFAYVGLEFLLQ